MQGPFCKTVTLSSSAGLGAQEQQEGGRRPWWRCSPALGALRVRLRCRIERGVEGDLEGALTLVGKRGQASRRRIAMATGGGPRWWRCFGVIPGTRCGGGLQHGAVELLGASASTVAVPSAESNGRRRCGAWLLWRWRHSVEGRHKTGRRRRDGVLRARSAGDRAIPGLDA
jgi:hypothetical protein